ncbi:MAG: alpha/beta fold hydrolase [Capnocytophaga sp.]|nr:alpha/beta fold hydrolase [Capnocytophaga sp.]
MPIIESSYNPSFPFRQADISTIYSGKIRSVQGVIQTRQRIELPDGDFIDVDWSYATQKTNCCIIILHGLEGCAQRPYVLGTAQIFNQNGYDACAMNFRGCSGSPNRLFSSYHSGKTDDLKAVINYVKSLGYSKIFIKGFSMGGNISLLHAGKETLPTEVKGIIAVSVPCDLKGASKRLLSRRNWIYSKRFLITLIQKIKEKALLFPEKLTLSEIQQVKNLKDFDNLYTSKAHNFYNADDYYEKCSSLPVLQHISIPTLIINALNDSFLSESCFPYKTAKKSDFLHLETPKYGGHVAFYLPKNVYYNEKRALEFFISLRNT